MNHNHCQKCEKTNELLLSALAKYENLLSGLRQKLATAEIEFESLKRQIEKLKETK